MNDGDLIKLPISVPWNAPEVDRLNRQWTPSEAKQADLFSLGMLCLWILFESYFSAATQPPEGVQLISGQHANSLQPREDSRHALLRAKPELESVARRLLTTVKDVDQVTMGSLETFLVLCLSQRPTQRQVPKQFFVHQDYGDRQVTSILNVDSAG